MDDARRDWLMAAVESAADIHILPRFRALAAGDIRSKSAPDDLVTEADLACEAALTADLARHWPEALVVGEEAVSCAIAGIARAAALAPIRSARRRCVGEKSVMFMSTCSLRYVARVQ